MSCGKVLLLLSTIGDAEHVRRMICTDIGEMTFRYGRLADETVTDITTVSLREFYEFI